MKTDRILNDLYEKKESIGNLTEAMQETAVQFAEWCDINATQTSSGIWVYKNNPSKSPTTAELFTIFNNEE